MKKAPCLISSKLRNQKRRRYISRTFTIITLCFTFLANNLLISAQDIKRYFIIKVIDQETGRGVPLVELKTTNNISNFTDNNGVVAFYEPGLMNMDVYFHIKSHGYEYPKDGFGYHGKSLKIIPGDSAIISLKRINIAERLYRVTGQGLYNNSQIAGLPMPLKKPLLNGKVMGQDTFIETSYNGKMYWFWGDTDKPSYPLGNFSTSGATSELPGNGSLDPAQGVDLTYFVDPSGFSKQMYPGKGPGPVWMHWLTTINDSTNSKRLIGSYTRVKTLGEYYERGLAVFNDSSEIFEPFIRFDVNSPFFPDGQSFRVIEDGQEYIYFDFSDRYPMRVLADLKHIKDLSSYQSFTCLKEGSKYDTITEIIDRSERGKLIYGWKINTEPLNPDKEKYLLKKGILKPDEAWYTLCDFLTGDFVTPKSGSVYWNEYRKKWIMIFEQIYGTSFMGEVWYAEADTPTGPWVYAQKIVTHDNYTFYNVGQHPIFDQDNGRLVYFEGTYTNSFSGNPIATPYYNYNQIMYRLDLHDSRLYLPSPVYTIIDKKSGFRNIMRKEAEALSAWELIQEIPFFALQPDRNAEGSIPVYEVVEKGRRRLVLNSPDKSVKPLFYSLPVSGTRDTSLDGTWDCKADEYVVQIVLQFDGEKVKGRFSNDPMIIKKGIRLKDSIELIIEDTTDLSSYIIEAQITDSILIGKFRNVKTSETGIFSGERVFNNSQGFSSPMIVPLYEFKNKNGFYTYSIKEEQEGLQRSEKPICRVWKNPSSVLFLDFKAKPIRMTK